MYIWRIHNNFGEERKRQWRAETTGYTGMVPATQLGTNNYSRLAKEVRDRFKRYFSSNEGMVSWQLDYVTRMMDPFEDVDVSTEEFFLYCSIIYEIDPEEINLFYSHIPNPYPLETLKVF